MLDKEPYFLLLFLELLFNHSVNAFVFIFSVHNIYCYMVSFKNMPKDKTTMMEKRIFFLQFKDNIDQSHLFILSTKILRQLSSFSLIK